VRPFNSASQISSGFNLFQEQKEPLSHSGLGLGPPGNQLLFSRGKRDAKDQGSVGDLKDFAFAFGAYIP